jgi:hypothetical protein
MKGRRQKQNNRRKESCGNAGSVESEEAKDRLPTLSTSPLEISPTAGAIPTFPQLRRRGGGKVENQNRVSYFSTATNPIVLFEAKKHGRRRGFAPRLPVTE